MTDLPLTPRCWSTEDVQPRDALAYWCDSICQVMLELEIEAAGSRITLWFSRGEPLCASFSEQFWAVTERLSPQVIPAKRLNRSEDCTPSRLQLHFNPRTPPARELGSVAIRINGVAR